MYYVGWLEANAREEVGGEESLRCKDQSIQRQTNTKNQRGDSLDSLT